MDENPSPHFSFLRQAVRGFIDLADDIPARELIQDQPAFPNQCGRDAAPLAVERRYDFLEFWGYLGMSAKGRSSGFWDRELTRGTITIGVAALALGLVLSGPAHTSDPPTNLPPDCSLAEPNVKLLWPPDHEFLPVTIQGVTDPDGDPLIITIDSIVQDEPVDVGCCAGATSPDGQGIRSGVAEVRAERDGKGNGRVYTIGFSALDPFGAVCSSYVQVGVATSRGLSNTPVDDGPLYDSTLP